MSTKTLENQTFLSGWLDEGAPGRSLAAFRSCIAPSGGDGVYTGCDWAAKMEIPDKRVVTPTNTIKSPVACRGRRRTRS